MLQSKTEQIYQYTMYKPQDSTSIAVTADRSPLIRVSRAEHANAEFMHDTGPRPHYLFYSGLRGRQHSPNPSSGKRLIYIL